MARDAQLFLQNYKKKFPAYANIEDTVLLEKVKEKYPQYSDLSLGTLPSSENVLQQAVRGAQTRGVGGSTFSTTADVLPTTGAETSDFFKAPLSVAAKIGSKLIDPLAGPFRTPFGRSASGAVNKALAPETEYGKNLVGQAELGTEVAGGLALGSIPQLSSLVNMPRGLGFLPRATEGAAYGIRNVAPGDENSELGGALGGAALGSFSPAVFGAVRKLQGKGRRTSIPSLSKAEGNVETLKRQTPKFKERATELSAKSKGETSELMAEGRIPSLVGDLEQQAYKDFGQGLDELPGISLKDYSKTLRGIRKSAAKTGQSFSTKGAFRDIRKVSRQAGFKEKTDKIPARFVFENQSKHFQELQGQAKNIAKEAIDNKIPGWKELKESYDAFENKPMYSNFKSVLQKKTKGIAVNPEEEKMAFEFQDKIAKPLKGRNLLQEASEAQSAKSSFDKIKGNIDAIASGNREKISPMMIKELKDEGERLGIDLVDEAVKHGRQLRKANNVMQRSKLKKEISDKIKKWTVRGLMIAGGFEGLRFAGKTVGRAIKNN